MTAVLAGFRELLADRLGWTFDDQDAAQLAAVLDERAAAGDLSRPDYLARLARGWDAEVAELAERLSITETLFFRHTEQFRALREVVLPERIAARRSQRVLRMLSVGCSSGEEAYSLAIAGFQARPGPDWIVAVLGVDANAAVLRKAAAAGYSSWSLRQTPEPVRRRWFRPAGDDFEVDPRIRSLVRFARHNVTDDDPQLWMPGRWDVVFCRNLLMYLTRAAAGTLVRRMTTSLAAGGYLFLGHTDSLGTHPDGLEPRHSHEAFYYRRPVPGVAPAARAAERRAAAEFADERPR